MASDSPPGSTLHKDGPATPPLSKQQEQEEEEQQQQLSDSDKACGLGSCQPQWLQPLARPGMYVLCISLTVFIQALLIAGYTNSIVSTIERRYNLRSTESGFIISSYDITCIFTVILVSYYGDRHSRAKWIGRSLCVMSVGAILFAMPHFVGGKYKHLKSSAETEFGLDLCNSTRNLEAHGYREPDPDCSVGNPKTWAYALFVIANMTIGIGTSTIYTLGPTYMYDNVKRELYSVYSATMYSMAALGPAAGFLLGAFILTIYVDIGSTPPGVDKDTPGWVGAWWLGFLLCAFLGFLVAFPMMLFPKQLPTTKAHTAEDAGGVRVATYGTNIKGLPVMVWALLTNKTWLCVSLALVMEQSISTGFVTFIAKFFEVSYGVSTMKANIITGAVIIPGAFLGIILGGYMMKKLSLDLYGISKVLLISSLVPTLAVVILLFLGCRNIDLVGVTAQYGTSEKVVDVLQVNYKGNLTSKCNDLCGCSQTLYEPVCGYDKKTYFSPCHAGCTNRTVHRTPEGATVKNYSSCACIYDDFVPEATASTGKCDNGCYNLIPFLVILFILVFITCLGHNAVLLITLGSVDQGSMSFALGMQNVLVRLIAFIPPPIYFGRIFDTACVLFASSCGGTGACLEYDSMQLPVVFCGTCLALKLAAYVFHFLTFLSLRPKNTKSSYNLDRPDSSVAVTADTDVSTVCTSYTREDSLPFPAYRNMGFSTQSRT